MKDQFDKRDASSESVEDACRTGGRVLVISFLSQISGDAWITAIGTLLGAFIGASLAGYITIRTLKKQLNHEKFKEERIKSERNNKLNILLKRFTDETIIKLGHIDYLVVEVDEKAKEYEIMHRDEIEFLKKHIERLENFLNGLDIDITSIDKYEEVQGLIFQLSQLQHHLHLYLRNIGGNMIVREIKSNLMTIEEMLKKFK